MSRRQPRQYVLVLGNGNPDDDDLARHTTSSYELHQARRIAVQMLNEGHRFFANMPEETRRVNAAEFHHAMVGDLMAGKLIRWSGEGGEFYFGILEKGQAPKDRGKIPGSSTPSNTYRPLPRTHSFQPARRSGYMPPRPARDFRSSRTVQTPRYKRPPVKSPAEQIAERMAKDAYNATGGDA